MRWEPNIWCVPCCCTNTTIPHLEVLTPCQRPKSSVPVSVFLGGWSLLMEQSFSSFLTTKSLARIRPLFTPFWQSVTSPLSHSATMISAPWPSTLALRAPFRETCKDSGEGLANVAYKHTQYKWISKHILNFESIRFYQKNKKGKWSQNFTR